MAADSRSETFRRLHADPQILRLANAWDAGSAVAFQSSGCPAIGTTSAGVANALGRADGEITRDEMLTVTRLIVDAVDVPVTADIETGFGDDAAAVAATVTAVLDCGAVGVNLEDALGDGLRDLDEQVERVRAASEAGGGHVFINARTDVYWAGIGADSERLALAISRARAYVEAGAAGIFIPGVVDPEVIAALVAAIDAPLNILAGPTAPTAGELERLGVARLSTGSGPARAALSVALRVGKELNETGTYTQMAADTVSYAEANALFEGRSPTANS